MSRFDNDEKRRQFLLRALRLGWYAAAGSIVVPHNALAMGSRPPKLPPGKSIYQVSGDVTIDGQPATKDTLVRPGARVRTGRNGKIIFVVGSDVFLVRKNSDLTLVGQDGVINLLRIVTGKVLSVFGKGEHRLATPLATIGIRGSGIYVESSEEISYVCTCYGEATITAARDPQSSVSFTSEHHDEPRFITADAAPGRNIYKAPVFNHTDVELVLLEALVGREVPFDIEKESDGEGSY